MGSSGNGRRSVRITGALVGAGGLAVATVTGAGLWLGHDEARTTTTEQVSGTTVAWSADGPATVDRGISVGSVRAVSDATTTGS
ncbi:hypothetical protein [Curtobacterium pusillum]|uniref:hypothetical protein n=1 Tax=Curtobacterium pusillum TaxID=69373 RepID=UPI00119F9C0F|nr:hypothetical protein [Curtobacterium pusillum]